MNSLILAGSLKYAAISLFVPQKMYSVIFRLLPGKRAFCEVTDEILDSLEVLVDGPFLESRKNISLRFRGSDNQRLIHMPETRRTGRVVLLPDRDTGSGK